MRYLVFFCLLVTPIAGAAQSLERIGDLRYRRLIDEITDDDRSLIYTAEVNAREVRTGQTIPWIGRVIWRCDGRQVEVILRADSLPTDSATIRWRVDDHSASDPETWKTGASGVSVFAPHVSASVLTGLAKMGERLIVRVKYEVGGDFDYEFSLEGAADAISRLACDPDGHTDEAPQGQTHIVKGTTHAMWGSYNRYHHDEAPWALHRQILLPLELRFSL